MTIQEKRWMDMDNLRALCIRHGWFTRGDCKAYDKFLNMPYDAKGTQRNITTKLLYRTALIPPDPIDISTFSKDDRRAQPSSKYNRTKPIDIPKQIT